MTRAFPTIALASLTLAALGLQAAPSAAQLLTGRRVAPNCSAVPERFPLPTLAGVADTTGLDAGLAAALQPHGWATLALSWDSTGAPGEVRPVEAAPGQDGRAVARLLQPRLRPQQPVVQTVRPQDRAPYTETRGWGILVRVDAGTPPTVRTAWQEECPPDLLRRAEVARRLNHGMSMLENKEAMGLPRVAVLRMRLDSTGAVSKAEVSRSSGVNALDQLAYEVWMGARFRPAYLNRRPVAVWVTLPVEFKMAPPGWSDAPEQAAGRPGMRSPRGVP